VVTKSVEADQTEQVNEQVVEFGEVHGALEANGTCTIDTIVSRTVEFGQVNSEREQSRVQATQARGGGSRHPSARIVDRIGGVAVNQSAVAHDGEVTVAELANIHQIDKFCLVVFPLTYIVLTIWTLAS
jgi:hypothetical protein